MWSFIVQHKLALLGSLAVHVVLVALLTVSISLTRPFDVRPPQVAVRATVVDAARIEEELQKLEQAERAEELAQQRRAEEARKAAEREQQRLAELRRREQAEREEQRRIERQQETERQRLAEIERQRAEAERQQQAEEQRLARLREQRAKEEEERRKAEAEARARAEREAQLQAELAAEEERRRQAYNRELDRYRTILAQRVERNWLRPPTARPGLDCSVEVRQLPDGSVISVRVLSCNGDAAVVRSIEVAVQRASPLPLPEDRSLFQREIIFDFRPKD